MGLTPYFWVGAAAVALCGASDAVGATMRKTVVQTQTPLDMLGRAQAGHSLSANVANSVGQFYVGFMSDRIGAGTTMMIGGGITWVAVALVLCFIPKIWAFRAHADPVTSEYQHAEENSSCSSDGDENGDGDMDEGNGGDGDGGGGGGGGGDDGDDIGGDDIREIEEADVGGDHGDEGSQIEPDDRDHDEKEDDGDVKVVVAGKEEIPPEAVIQ